MDNKSSLTSLMSSFARTYYAENSRSPVFSDHIARKLFSDEEYENMKNYVAEGAAFFASNQNFADKNAAVKYIVDTQLAPTPVARARYCEDCLKTAVQTGTTQYVILGAGLDTFAWRELGLMKKVTVFEVDHPLTQADKIKRLSSAGLNIPNNLRFVAVDFTDDNLKTQLLKNGFDMTQKTFFSWLGVSYYLSADENSKLLGEIEAFAAEGSTLLFDYADDGLFEATEQRVRHMLDMAKASGEPMKFCCSEMELTLLLDKHHFLIYEHLSPEDINRQFFENNNDVMTAFEHICYVTAVLKGTPFINTKEKILQTSLKLFAKDGYEAVSVKDISDQLSLTKAALYKHYQCKRDIFDQLLTRMQEQDAQRAKAYEMPVKTIDQDLPAYRKTQLKSILAYTEAQFYYWTEDPFASRFRRMLTLEQYRDTEMTTLYQQYLCCGPFGYIRDIFMQMFSDAETAQRLAVDFYAPVFMLYSLYDGLADKTKPKKILKKHLSCFAEQIKKEQENGKQ